ncbi:MAG TPA: LptA/OstA family protein [Oligoflexia bacterium]|nr:LptA/OstA family protein [Oligoflexia bacterium]
MITIKVPEVLLGSLFSLIIVFSVNSSMAFAQTGDVSSKVEKSNDSGSGLKKALGGGGDSKGPVFIKSDSLMLDSKDRLFTYKGNVRVVRDDLEITTDIMIGRYGENQELESILCQSNVVITRGESMRATSNRAFYNLKSAKIELTDEPELARDGNLLAADKITIFVDEDRSEAEGNVRVKVIKADETGSGGERMRGIVKKQPVTESE